MQNLCFGPECTISGCQRCESSILLRWTQYVVWECFRAFRSPLARRRCETCVSGLNALFRGAKDENHPFYSIGPKMMFESVSEHFANLCHIKDVKLVFEPEFIISGYRSCEASILLHWTRNDVWECFRAFC
jgi:hypothetical protein